MSITPRRQLWEEELSILLASAGAIRSEDVRRMTPEKREWTLRRLLEMRKAVK
jgi:hypothetical protein